MKNGANDMRSPKQPPMQSGSSDDFQTPPEALYALYPFLKKEWTIWECATGRGNLSKALEQHGYKVIATDILEGHDFLTWRPEKPFDVIITNPPYSLKQEFLIRAYKLQKPFALLLPLTTFETPKRQSLFQKYGVQVIFFPKRINFTTPSGEGSGAWFMTAWFTWGLGLPREFNFVHHICPEQARLEV